MRKWIIIRGALHTIVFYLASSFTPLTAILGIPWLGYSWRGTYFFVWPEVFLSVIALILDIAILLRDRSGGQLFWFSLILEPLLVFGWWFPLLFRLWPGGDDGGGLAWGQLLGTACALSATTGAIAAWYAIRNYFGTPLVSRNARLILSTGVIVTAGIFDLWLCRYWFGLLLS